MQLRRWLLLAVTITLGIVATTPAVQAAPAGVSVLVLDGKGFGHGVGLSQWGAMYMAQNGASHEDILSTFYPNTDRGAVGDPDVRVSVLTADSGQTTLAFPNGGEVRSALGGDQQEGFPVEVAPGGSVLITFDGTAYHVDPIVTGQAAARAVAWHSSTAAAAPADDSCIPVLGDCQPNCPLGCGSTTTAPPSTTTSPPPDPSAPNGGGSSGTDAPPPTESSPSAVSSTPVWAVAASNGVTSVVDRNRRYRGYLEAIADGGALRVLNQLDVDTYLKGMGEMPGDWPFEALAAQAVVARTYALRAMAASGELCDYDLCQVYVGADQETAGQTSAVDATSGEVVTFAGALASTVYSADAGGVSATPHEGFGAMADDAYPYLTTVRYDTPNPLPWHVEVALSDLASRVGYQGTLDSVSIKDAGPSGRALAVELDGSSGAQLVDGHDFARNLGLRSTLFTPDVKSEATAPPPPDPSVAVGQALPDDAAALRAAARSGVTRVAASRFDAEQAASTRAAPGKASVHRHAVDLMRAWATWIALGAITLVGTSHVVQRQARELRARRGQNQRGAPSR